MSWFAFSSEYSATNENEKDSHFIFSTFQKNEKDLFSCPDFDSMFCKAAHIDHIRKCSFIENKSILRLPRSIF